MGVLEIIVIIACAAIVIGVVVSRLIAVKRGKKTCDCGCDCGCCDGCSFSTHKDHSKKDGGEEHVH